MASPQLENGFTRITNEILEHLSHPGINGSEYRILLVVLRKTFGFNKKKDMISLSQYENATKMGRKEVVETIKDLVGKKILVKKDNVYQFNKNWEEWVVGKRPPQWAIAPQGSGQKPTKSSGQKPTHKRKKETNTKDSAETSSADIVLLLDMFIKINPAVKRMFGNTTQRKACRELIDTYGLERLQKIIIYTLPKTNSLQFFPTITTPLQLQDKYIQLESAIKKYQSESNKLKSNVAF